MPRKKIPKTPGKIAGEAIDGCLGAGGRILWQVISIPINIGKKWHDENDEFAARVRAKEELNDARHRDGKRRLP